MSDKLELSDSKNIIGGGAKKVLYTLKTVKKIGLKNSSKALKSNNACKACGLGMGGQQGGMTNELGEFKKPGHWCDRQTEHQKPECPIPQKPICVFNGIG